MRLHLQLIAFASLATLIQCHILRGQDLDISDQVERLLADYRSAIVAKNRSAAERLGAELRDRRFNSQSELNRFLDHPDEGVKELASDLLLRMATPESIRALFDRVAAESQDSPSRANLIAVIRRLDSPCCNSVFLEVLRGAQSEDSQQLAASMLARFGNEEALNGAESVALDPQNSTPRKTIALKLVEKLGRPELTALIGGRLLSTQDEPLIRSYGVALGTSATQEALASLRMAVGQFNERRQFLLARGFECIRATEAVDMLEESLRTASNEALKVSIATAIHNTPGDAAKTATERLLALGLSAKVRQALIDGPPGSNAGATRNSVAAKLGKMETK